MAARTSSREIFQAAEDSGDCRDRVRNPYPGIGLPRERVTWLHERSGRPFAAMLWKRRGTRWRRSKFQTAGMSNKPPGLLWAFRETRPHHQALAYDLEKRFPEDTFAK